MPHSLVQKLWSTGWNKEWLNGSVTWMHVHIRMDFSVKSNQNRETACHNNAPFHFCFENKLSKQMNVYRFLSTQNESELE